MKKNFLKNDKNSLRNGFTQIVDFGFVFENFSNYNVFNII